MSFAKAELVDASGDSAQLLAGDMIEVHGAEAATIARDNARQAAIAARLPQAKRWLKVLDLIQRQCRAEATAPPRGPEVPPPISSDN